MFIEILSFTIIGIRMLMYMNVFLKFTSANRTGIFKCSGRRKQEYLNALEYAFYSFFIKSPYSREALNMLASSA
jgi:hypothetical protein